MEFPIMHTKITIPRRRGELLTRRRLNELFLELLDCKLIIIASPPGYGKTTLMIDLAHQGELPFCWFTLDHLDSDPVRFVAQFISAIAQKFPGFGEKSSAVLQNAVQGEFPLDALVALLVNEAFELIREHFVVVLDDFHLVDEDSEVNTFVSRFIQNVDENCHLVILSRSMLPLPDLPLMVARSQVGGMGFHELAFQPEEIQDLLMQNYQLTIPKTTAEEIARESEGWITGVLLSSQLMGQGVSERLRVARVSGVDLYEYLAHQVLDQLPKLIRGFLLSTSLFDEFDASFCESVLGKPPNGATWQGLIDWVLRNNLFALPVGEGGTWLRYHHLFRDFLQSCLAEEEPKKRERILRSLALTHASREEWEKAYSIYKSLDDIPRVSELIDEAGTSMVKRGRVETLREWLDELPREVLLSHPGLMARRGIVAAVQGEITYGLTLLDKAVDAFRVEANQKRLAGALVWRAFARYMQASFEDAMVDANEAISLTRKTEDQVLLEAEALRILGLNCRLMGRLDDAIQNLSSSLRIYHLENDQQSMARVYLDLGAAYLDAFNYSKAMDCYQSALNIFELEENIFAMPAVLNDLGYLLYLKGDYKQAVEILGNAIHYLKQSGYSKMEAFVLVTLGDAYVDLNAYKAASEAYILAREISTQTSDRKVMLYLTLAEANLAGLRGKHLDVQQLLKDAEELVENSRSSYEEGLFLLEAGRQFMLVGQYDWAARRFERAVDIFERGGQKVEGARAYFYLAVCYFELDRRQEATKSLNLSFQFASNLENQHILVIAGKFGKKMLKSMVGEARIGYKASLLLGDVDKFESEVPSLRRQLRKQKPVVPLGPPRLVIQALGWSQVTLDEKPVSGADWQSSNARDLFYLLLSHRDGMTKEMLGDTLWPDSSPGQLKLRFKNTLYRLRHALQLEVILFQDERYIFNRKLDYEYDVESFWDFIRQAESTHKIRERKKFFSAAIQLYKGPYLPEVSGSWVITERERIYKEFVKTSMKLAEIYLDNKEYEQVIDHCNRILGQDQCIEEAHRLVMKANAALGNRVGIIRQFERCQQALMGEVGLTPSPQTQALYQSLIR
jgi:LuxR family transcriptional regulator, maltose regulon positive regulatory protein